MKKCHESVKNCDETATFCHELRLWRIASGCPSGRRGGAKGYPGFARCAHPDVVTLVEASMGGGGFGWGFEGFGEEDERGGDEGDNADDVEDVHEGEELGLGVELLVDSAVGGSDGVGGGEAVGLQVGGGLLDVLLERG